MSSISFELDRPSSGNSFGIEQAEQLQQALAQSLAEKKPLVISAKGRLFCAGGDMKAYAEFTDKKPGIDINRKIRAVLDQVNEAPVPTLAVVQGDCFGGGVEVISACDKVIAVEHACFGFWQRKIGLSFGWGGAQRLLRRLNERTIINMALEAKTFSAQTAKAMGLIDEVVPHHFLEEAKTTWIQRMNELSNEPVGVLKGGLENEVKGFEKIWMNADHQQALKRFR
jgi:enoyl-CoA hydratase/carnithine racemase